MRHGRSRRHPCGTAFLEQRIESGYELSNLILSRLRLIFRRHLAAVELIERLSPVVRVPTCLEVSRQSVDPNVTFLPLRSMTPKAVLLQKSFKRCRCRCRRPHENEHEETRRAFRQQFWNHDPLRSGILTHFTTQILGWVIGHRLSHFCSKPVATSWAAVSAQSSNSRDPNDVG